MRKIRLFIIVSLVGLCVWLLWPGSPASPQTGQQENQRKSRLIRDKGTLHDRVLARVHIAASSVLPNIDFQGNEGMPFSQIDDSIKELDVLEVVLAIETEFELDLSQAQIIARLGEDHHRDLRSHLSLRILAELVEARQAAASPRE